MSYDSAVRSEYSKTTLASGYMSEENMVNYSPIPRASLEHPYVPPCGEDIRMRQHDDCYSSHHIPDGIVVF